LARKTLSWIPNNFLDCFEYVEQWLDKESKSQMRNNQKITIKQIADMAGVSIATVSRVINNKSTVKDDTRRKILDLMEKVNFNSSPALTTNQTSRTILLCVPDFNNPFNSLVISGIQQSAARNYYRVLILQSKELQLTFEDFENILKNHSFAGIILLTSVTDIRIMELLSVSGPIVMCSEYCDVNDISFVSIDNVTAARTATEYLIRCGCKKIALLNFSLQFSFAKQREQGYLEALKNLGLEQREEWIAHISSMNYESAYSYANNLFSLPNRPDACFAVTDVYAVAVLRAARKMRLRIPEDVSVIGFDDIELSSMTNPSITTVKQPSIQIGYQACELLIEKINNPYTSKKRLILNSELVVRESTAHPVSS
jgi:DNA-binding LacI/PurR family transcriptional regulator